MTQLFYMKTFGCQMNEHDTDCISQILIKKGYRQAEDMDDAHIILINTCAVREKAEQKALDLVGRLAQLKRRKPALITGVIGCAAQARGINLLKSFPFLDLVLGPRSIYRIDEFLSEIKEERERISCLDLKGELVLFPYYNGYLHGKVKCFLKLREFITF